MRSLSLSAPTMDLAVMKYLQIRKNPVRGRASGDGCWKGGRGDRGRPARSGGLFRRDCIGVGQIVLGHHLVVVPAKERGQRLGITLDAFVPIDRRRTEPILDHRRTKRFWQPEIGRASCRERVCQYV